MILTSASSHTHSRFLSFSSQHSGLFLAHIAWHLSPSLKKMDLGKQPTGALEMTQGHLGKEISESRAPRTQSRRGTTGTREAQPWPAESSPQGRGTNQLSGSENGTASLLAQETPRMDSWRELPPKRGLFQEGLSLWKKPNCSNHLPAKISLFDFHDFIWPVKQGRFHWSLRTLTMKSRPSELPTFSSNLAPETFFKGKATDEFPSLREINHINHFMLHG